MFYQPTVMLAGPESKVLWNIYNILRKEANITLECWLATKQKDRKKKDTSILEKDIPYYVECALKADMVIFIFHDKIGLERYPGQELDGYQYNLPSTSLEELWAISLVPNLSIIFKNNALMNRDLSRVCKMVKTFRSHEEELICLYKAESEVISLSKRLINQYIKDRIEHESKAAKLLKNLTDNFNSSFEGKLHTQYISEEKIQSLTLPKSFELAFRCLTRAHEERRSAKQGYLETAEEYIEKAFFFGLAPAKTSILYSKPSYNTIQKMDLKTQLSIYRQWMRLDYKGKFGHHLKFEQITCNTPLQAHIASLDLARRCLWVLALLEYSLLLMYRSRYSEVIHLYELIAHCQDVIKFKIKKGSLENELPDNVLTRWKELFVFNAAYACEPNAILRMLGKDWENKLQYSMHRLAQTDIFTDGDKKEEREEELMRRFYEAAAALYASFDTEEMRTKAMSYVDKAVEIGRKQESKINKNITSTVTNTLILQLAINIEGAKHQVYRKEIERRWHKGETPSFFWQDKYNKFKNHPTSWNKIFK